MVEENRVYRQIKKIIDLLLHQSFSGKFGEIRGKYALHLQKLLAPTPMVSYHDMVVYFHCRLYFRRYMLDVMIFLMLSFFKSETTFFHIKQVIFLNLRKGVLTRQPF